MVAFGQKVILSVEPNLLHRTLASGSKEHGSSRPTTRNRLIRRWGKSQYLSNPLYRTPVVDPKNTGVTIVPVKPANEPEHFDQKTEQITILSSHTDDGLLPNEDLWNDFRTHFVVLSIPIGLLYHIMIFLINPASQQHLHAEIPDTRIEVRSAARSIHTIPERVL